jgi:hypothetical protein
VAITSLIDMDALRIFLSSLALPLQNQHTRLYPTSFNIAPVYPQKVVSEHRRLPAELGFVWFDTAVTLGGRERIRKR